MTTTETKAKRTDGDLQVMNLFELYTVGGTEKRIGIVNQRRIGNEEAEANAEFIRKAWNLHDELVAFVEATLMARGWFEDHPELALSEIEHRAKVVSVSLAKAKS